MSRDEAVLWHGFTQMSSFAANSPVIVERAEGRELIDVDGNRYLDAISSLWVTTLGHRVPELDEAIAAQLGRIAHSTMLGNSNRVTIELAEALSGVVPVDTPHFIFASDGAAAVEQALKIAFQFWANQGVSERTSYLTLSSSYHGDSIGSLSLGSDGFSASLFDPLRFPVLRAPGYDDPGWADTAISMLRSHAARLAAVVIEPLVQGAAGMLMTTPADVRRLAEACQASGTLLICDEVATGFGRTGELFASERCGVRPDLLCLGKGLTGGYLPMSVTAASQRVYNAFLGPDLGDRTFYHGHSYGGNALAAAVALRHLQLIQEPDVLANVRARSSQLKHLLQDRVMPSPWVRAARVTGLMTGIELAPPTPGLRWGRRVCAAATGHGVLLRPLGDVIVVVPPLTTTAAEIERIVDVIARSLCEVCR
ncbi:MAG: adenosylmethionine--8-amino-7-oxononanoate transaminase [Actinobacteria bacterium]|nr:adenosylmethionine--8-amino-7-oxononanoate transaminase [Actinomycetota bacterium]